MTTTLDAGSPAADRPLLHLPVALFGSVMGLVGLSSAWRQAHARFGAPVLIHELIGAMAGLVFLALAAAYVGKWIQAPGVVRAEFDHPIAGNLFGTPIISMLLLPLVIAPVSLRLAQALWVVGAIAMVAFAWYMVDRWMGNLQKPEHATPAWIIPVVGMLDVPLAMPVLQLPPELHIVRLLGLAIGLFFALPLFTLILSRLLFQPPMPPALQPSLLILIAPFSVGMSSYVVTVGRVDLFAQALFLIALFLLAVLAGRLRYLLRCCPFRVSWWAVSFPLASTALAALRMAEVFDHPVADALAWVLLIGASAVIAWLLVRTVLGIARGELKTLTT